MCAGRAYIGGRERFGPGTWSDKLKTFASTKSTDSNFNVVANSAAIQNVADLVKVDPPDPFRLHLGHHEVGVAPAPISEHMGYL